MSLGDAEEMEITAAAFKDLGGHLSGHLLGRGNGELSMIHYDRIAVIGAGLIGSSLLRADRRGWSGRGNACL